MGEHAPKVILIGAGAQAKYACETFRLRSVEITGVMNLGANTEVDWPDAYGCRVLAADTDLREAIELGATHAVVCVAHTEEKARWWARAEAAGLAPQSAIHPTAVIASTAQVGPGCIVNAQAVIQPFAAVGRGVMIHAHVTIEHDSVVGDFANLAPGAQLAGWVHIEERATVFTGASVIPRVRVGRGATVGAGAAVTKDVPPEAVVVGVPARVVPSVRGERTLVTPYPE
jgi:sugar O-acyltransferase (sialic acid O-acetyltransferase NeuD family)